MKYVALSVAALLIAAPALAISKVDNGAEAARIAAERNDPWHIKHLGPVTPPLLSNLPSAVAAVPEPASWAMMVGGFGMIGGALRRRGMKRVTA